MVDICPQCGDCGWNKAVAGGRITCHECGHSWAFLQLPLFIVTGASGVGKTTAVQALQAMSRDFVCLDGDMFYNIMPHETEDDYLAQTEQLMAFARNVMQCGRPTVWAKAGNIDQLGRAYGRRFFNGVSVLALTCPEEELRRRMTHGRGIADPGWLQSSADYNRYFAEHDNIGGVKYDRLEVGGLSVPETAGRVAAWLHGRMESCTGRAGIY